MHDEELFDLIRSTLLKYCNEGEPLTDENGYVICTGGEVIEDENGKRVLHNPTICRKPPSASQVANGIKLLQMQLAPALPSTEQTQSTLQKAADKGDKPLAVLSHLEPVSDEPENFVG